MPLSSKVIKQVRRELQDFEIGAKNVRREQQAKDPAMIKVKLEEAENILNNARREAKELLEKAEKEALDIKENARKEGYEKGYREGSSDAREEVQREAEAIYKNAKDVLAEANKIRQEIYGETENEIVELAVQMAEKIVCRQLDLVPETIVDIVKDVLQRKREAQQYIIYANPQDVDFLRETRQDIVSYLDTEARIQIVADGNIQPGGCRVETEQGYIDAELETRLKKLGMVLKGEIL